MTLSVGDAVLWRGAWGQDAPRRAVVRGLERTLYPREKDGDPVDSLEWDTVRAGYAVVSLDNGHWAYGDQIFPLT